MKKTLYSVMAALILCAAPIALTSCEDVPEPYNIPTNNNGESGDDSGTTAEAKGEGTLESPYNSIAANNYISTLAAGVESENDIYVKGVVASIKEEFNTSYGNGTFYLSDDGTSTNQFYVYRALYLGNKKFTSSDTQIQVGDTVVVCGKVVNYGGNTPETVQNKAYVYSINSKSGSGDTPETPETPDTPSEGNGSYASPYNVTSALAAASGTGVYVKAYIVGCVNDKSISTASFDASNMTSQTNILVAASADETNAANCMPVQLPSGDIRSKLNLKDNPSNLKQEVLLYGNIEKYFSVTGIKSVTYAEIGGSPIGTKPGESTKTDGYKQVTTMAEGKYIVAAVKEGTTYVVAKPLNSTYTYGYFYTADATLSDGVLGATEENEFTFKATDGGYTIQDTENRYYYMTGTYNSFNVSTEKPSEGAVWTVTFNTDNTVNITNATMSKTIQYSSQYTSFGAYSSISNTLPCLFKK